MYLMQVLWPRRSQRSGESDAVEGRALQWRGERRSGGDGASNQESGGKRRQSATSDLYYHLSLLLFTLSLY